jgi:chromosome segregation ATPase
MDWLRQHMRNHVRNVRPFPTAERAADTEPAGALSPAGTEALDLVHAAADVLWNMEEKSAAVETRARAFAHRASEELKRARDRIQALEADCERLNGLAVESNDRLLGAEKAVEEAQARIAVLETQLAESEGRAVNAENMLTILEDTIRCEILEPMRPITKTRAAA